MNIDETFPLKLCLNQSRREEQRFRMDLEFYKLGWDVERIKLANAKFVRRTRGHLTTKRYIALLGHRMAIRKAKLSGSSAVLIFEDDVEFHPLLSQHLEGIHLPDDWGVLYLGCTHHDLPEPVAPGLVRVSRATGSHAYAVKADRLNDVLRSISEDGSPTLGVDACRAEGMLWPSSLHKKIPCYAIMPNLAWSGERELENSHRAQQSDSTVRHYESNGRQLLPLRGLHELARRTEKSQTSVQRAPVLKEPKTIVAKLSGGLGNQMFQYAFASSLAKDLRANLVLRGDGLDRGPTPRLFGLGMFGIQCATFPSGSQTTLSHWEDTSDEWRLKALRHIARASAKVIVLEGLWQNPALFGGHIESVREKFTLDPIFLPEVSGKTPICLQVRRGDFVTDTRFDVCRANYFLSAMQIVRGLVKEPHFVVVSDGLDWCREWLTKSPDVTFYGTLGEEQDQRVMQGCKGFIISNSTYGWWPAWITQARVVVRPNRWTWNQEQWSIWPEHWIALTGSGLPYEDAHENEPTVPDPNGAHLSA